MEGHEHVAPASLTQVLGEANGVAELQEQAFPAEGGDPVSLPRPGRRWGYQSDTKRLRHFETGLSGDGSAAGGVGVSQAGEVQTGAELGPQTPPAQVPPLMPRPLRPVSTKATMRKIQRGALEGLSVMGGPR